MYDMSPPWISHVSCSLKKFLAGCKGWYVVLTTVQTQKPNSSNMVEVTFNVMYFLNQTSKRRRHKNHTITAFDALNDTVSKQTEQLWAKHANEWGWVKNECNVWVTPKGVRYSFFVAWTGIDRY